MAKANLLLPCVLLILHTGCGSGPDHPVRQDDPRWFKGNLHTHSYWSDGDEFPEVILNWYREAGYDFVALSDHNTLAEGENWKVIPNDSLYQQAFRKYLDTYGTEWVRHKNVDGETSVKLKTFDEYRNVVEEPGKFLVIQAEEITDKFEDKHLHMNATNIQEKIDPAGGNSVVEVLQANLDQVLRQSRLNGVPILPHINHPNFYYSIGLEDMIALEGERFFEVYNGHPLVRNMGDSTHFSTEAMWDLINIAYLAEDKPLLYGLATDDSHHYHKKGREWSNAGRGWVVVRADTLSPTSLIRSLEAGNFYASTGVVLDTMDFEDNVLRISVEEEKEVHYTIDFIGLREGDAETTVLKSINGPSAEYVLTEDIQFVRSKITSSKPQGNPVEDTDYERAWTQPMVGRATLAP